jgi:dihydrofolate reductase
MGKVTFAMMLSLDGYIAGREGGPSLPPPDEALHRHFNELQRQSTVSLYGRRMYEVMQYWETADQQPDAPEVAIEFARLWKSTPKVVVSTTLTSVGPNARLATGNLEQLVKSLCADPAANVGVGGAGLAASLSRLNLIDEYRLYFYPLVLGGGTPFFEAGSSLKLEPIGEERLSQGVVMLRYRPIA